MVKVRVFLLESMMNSNLSFEGYLNSNFGEEMNRSLSRRKRDGERELAESSLFPFLYFPFFILDQERNNQN